MNSDTLQLIFVWFIGVVAFFVLWAILLKVIKRISEKKQKADAPTDETDKNSAPESFPSEG
jgi:flagellar biosynthesis/type III secretory pathway M-ring protein FliF/YscJ